MGRLHFELGQYQEAIELLRDPELRLLDPIAAVPAVRLLARSYAKLGQDDSARSYYLQAVGLQDNHTPDVDYLELGTLYRTMAERAPVSTARREYEQLAIAQWTHAVQSPGIDPAAKKELRAKIDVLRERGLQDRAAETIEPKMQSEPESIDPAAAAFGENLPWETLAPALDEDAGAAEDESGMEPSAEIAEENDPPVQMDSTLVETAATEEDDFSEMVEGAPPTEVIHHVVAGDTLSAIAAAHGVSVAELMEWNELNQSMILVGQELIVHGPKSQASDPSESVGENEEDNRESTY
jgi:LysM repeat protein